MIKTAIYGITGKMGSMVFENLADDDLYQVVGGVAKDCDIRKVSELCQREVQPEYVFADIDELIEKVSVDLLIDFSRSKCATEAIEKCLKSGIKVVSGTTGFSQQQLSGFRKMTEINSGSLLIAPNFSIGAVLMMKFSEIAAKYFNGCEIIELHHTGKADSPSGTASLTADRISSSSEFKPFQIENGREFRGGEVNGVRIHSVRLPGMLAHQEVIFGNDGDVLRIRHDSSDRNAFMPGIYKAIEKVCSEKGYSYGIDSLI